MDLSMTLSMMWTDERLEWNKTDFSGVDYIQAAADNIWYPDLRIQYTVYWILNEPVILYRILPDEYKYIKQNEFLTWKHDSNDKYQLLFLL